LEPTSDPALLDLIRRGDKTGLAQLYARYHERLLRYCARLLSDRQQAEDIVQNVFLKVLTCQHAIRQGESLQSWLFTVARNEAYTELGKKKMLVLDDTLVWNGILPDDELISKERDEIIDTVLSHLYLPFREVIVLRVYEQLSYEEIANITGTTVSSVKSRLFKARKALVMKLNLYFNERLL
jgi:RNA polymerase sigma-70 factor, ECF subfamily